MLSVQQWLVTYSVIASQQLTHPWSESDHFEHIGKNIPGILFGFDVIKIIIVLQNFQNADELMHLWFTYHQYPLP